MKRVAFLCIFIALLTSNGNSCIQYYVTDSSGERRWFHEDEFVDPTHLRKITEGEINQLKYFEEQIGSASSDTRFKYISNYCASLIKLGRYKDAIPILESLLKTHPKEYEINANLAVAYELNGQLDQALALLNKSLALKPDSHYNSEWVHLRILQAEIELRDKQSNLQEMDILKIQGDTQRLTGNHISYQLVERIPLTKSANNILSKVIEESADYYYSHYSIEWAIDLYAIAISYTSDSNTEARLWKKINSSREKIVGFKKKPEYRFRYLVKSNWKEEVNKRISEWRGYAPYYYGEKISKEFKAA